MPDASQHNLSSIRQMETFDSESGGSERYCGDTEGQPQQAFQAERRSSGRGRVSVLNPKPVDEMEHFFISYNQIRGKVFKPLGRFGPKRSLEPIQKGREGFAGTNKVKK